MASINISGNNKSLTVTPLDVYAIAGIGSTYADIPMFMVGKIYINKDNQFVIVEVQGVKDMILALDPNSLSSLCVNEINGVAPADLTDIVTKLKAIR